jgi:hypothetical protein
VTAIASQETTPDLWGGETQKAIENFRVSGEPIPRSVVRWLGRIKAASARTNAELGLLDSDLAERIANAADEVAEGKHDGQFPIDVFQTGSGTSSNTNACSSRPLAISGPSFFPRWSDWKRHSLARRRSSPKWSSLAART